MMLTLDQAMERIDALLSHAWMIRNFLKHADEIQEDAEMLEVHRMIFDYSRAVEPSLQRRDAAEYVRRARGKLSKLKKQAEYFAREYRRVSDHTNWQMAARSLSVVVADIEATLNDAPKGIASETDAVAE
ncbi:MAG: hypothetical protein K2X38_24795 [Gemmataceae bacterium]|nr:hypothetical protein [Gemmataceae bacterium]